MSSAIMPGATARAPFRGDTRLRAHLIGWAIAVVALFRYSFTSGPYPIPVTTVVSVFLHQIHLVEKTWSDSVELVVMGVRVVADPLNHLPTITFWLLGGLHRVTAPKLLAAAWPIGAAGEELLP